MAKLKPGDIYLSHDCKYSCVIIEVTNDLVIYNAKGISFDFENRGSFRSIGGFKKYYTIKATPLIEALL
jgi:hypothetical protein